MKLSSIIPRDFQRERNLRLFVFQNFVTEVSLILIPFLDCHWFEILRDKVHVEQSPLSLSLLVYHRPPNCGVASCLPSKRFPSYQLAWSFKEGYVKGNVKGGNETKIPESFFFVYMKIWTIFIWHLQVQANWAIHYDQMEVKGLDNNKLKYNSYMQQNIFLK
jgi:hypothetical protein